MRKHSEETKKKISDTLKRKGIKPPITHRKGKDNPSFGKHPSEETRKKMSLAKIGKPSWNKGLKGYKSGSENNKWNGGKPKCIDCGKQLVNYNSKRCNECYRKYNRGKNHQSWKGGITGLYEQIRHCLKYRQWVSDCLSRDNHTCQVCGKNHCYVEVHHIKSFAGIIKEYKIKSLDEAIDCQELWNINNGQTICLDCHKKTDSYKGKNKKGLRVCLEYSL